jgi:hypothetical protein
MRAYASLFRLRVTLNFSVTEEFYNSIGDGFVLFVDMPGAIYD